MKNISKISLLLAGGLFTVVAIAANIGKSELAGGEYKIRVLDDCKLVAEYPMTPAQIVAYQDLQKIEGTMAELEIPIKAIEQQMHEYSSKIEQLSALAIQETTTTLHIDKPYLKQQEAIAEQLDDLVSAHQADFDALSKQGEKISAIAHKFEAAMATTLDSIEHDQIEILTPTKRRKSVYCYPDISKL